MSKVNLSNNIVNIASNIDLSSIIVSSIICMDVFSHLNNQLQ